MVKLNKIYTRTGDDGTTGLADGSRRIKDDLRVEAYGTVDEANAAIGLAVVLCRKFAASDPRLGQIAEALTWIQHDLFDCGADLATPKAADEKPGSRLRILPAQTDRLEPLIDTFNDRMSALTSFVLPGGSEAAAALHVARTVARRAERLAVSLTHREPGQTNPETVKYLNRLSDLLFVLARAANQDGAADVLWVPGATRPRTVG
jgi:cob(I)alamin adenosyltransferase